MGRHSCCYKQKLRKGLWAPEEDEKLPNYVTRHGHGCWSSVPKLAGLQRCGKSCRLRWINYLRPDLERGSFSPDEQNLILDLHAVLGNSEGWWSQIAARLLGRTEFEIKNFWNSCLKKKLRQRGVHSSTHEPMSQPSSSSNQLNLLEIMASAKSTDSINLYNSSNGTRQPSGLLGYFPTTTIDPNPSFRFSSSTFLSSMSTQALQNLNFVEPTISISTNNECSNKESSGSNNTQSQSNSIYTSFFGSNSFPWGVAETEMNSLEFEYLTGSTQSRTSSGR